MFGLILKHQMKQQQKPFLKNFGTYTTSSWSESNSSSGGAVNKSNSMNLSQRSLLIPDEVLRIERPYLLVMLAREQSCYE